MAVVYFEKGKQLQKLVVSKHSRVLLWIERRRLLLLWQGKQEGKAR
jgi:hypothetical protein